jgi:hypothetical protein
VILFTGKQLSQQLTEAGFPNIFIESHFFVLVGGGNILLHRLIQDSFVEITQRRKGRKKARV